jgi:hypothetical protein
MEGRAVTERETERADKVVLVETREVLGEPTTSA